MPDRSIRGVGLHETVEVVPSVAPGFGAEAVAGQSFFDDPITDVVAVAAVADGSDGAAFVAMGPAVALGQVQQGVVAVMLDGLGVQPGVAGDLLDLVARVVVAAVAAASAVLDADQPAGGVVTVAAGDLGQFVVDGELSVPPDQLARQSTAGVVALLEGEGVAGGLLRRLVLSLGFQAAGIPGDLQSMAVAGKAFEPAEQVVGVGGFSAVDSRRDERRCRGRNAYQSPGRRCWTACGPARVVCIHLRPAWFRLRFQPPLHGFRKTVTEGVPHAARPETGERARHRHTISGKLSKNGSA